MAVALDRIAYFGERLSENIARSPEGYLICKNAVIGRSGFQNYKVSELSDPDGELERRYSPGDEIAVWRDPSEVFSPATIASFEGKVFTLTHPSELLDPDNTAEHAEGHVQNVRRGEPLPDGNIPLIADIIVTGRSAIRAIETDGARELSCGYTYRLAHEGERWDQREIQGNHIALVQKGRAGDLARINDEAPKEKRTVKSIRELFGIGLKEFSKTASPEELLEVARLTATDAATVDGERKTATDTNAAPTSIRILDEPPKINGNGKAKYVQTPDGKVFKLVAIDDDDHKGMDEEEEKKKMAADDKMRKGLHDALDALFRSKSSGDDAAFDTFKKQLDAYIEGGSKATDDDDDKKSAKDKDGDKEKADDKKTEHELAEMDDDEEEEEKEKSDDADIVRPEPVLGPGEPPKSALDEKMLRVIVADANLSMLKMLRPFVARSNDKGLIGAFDTATKALKAVVKDAKPSKGNYGEFRVAASALNSEARDSKDWKPRVTETEKRNTAIDKMYADVMASRGRPFSDRMKDRQAGVK